VYREVKHHSKGCGNHDKDSGRDHETNDDFARQGNPCSNDDLYMISFGKLGQADRVHLTGIGTSIRRMSEEILSTKPRIKGVPSSQVHCSVDGGLTWKVAE